MRLDEINLQNELGKTIEFSCVITDINVRQSRNGDYAVFTVIAGRVKEKVKWWNRSYTDEQIAERKGVIVKFTVTVEEYQGMPSLIAVDCKAIGGEVSEYLPRDENQEETIARFGRVLNSFEKQDGFLASFTCFVFERCWDKFITHPAAVTHHHNFCGGLLLHSVEVAEAAIAMARLNSASDGGAIMTDLVIAGALMHDIGKVEELSVDAGTGVIEYTPRGSLFGHAILGYACLREELLRFREDRGCVPVDEEQAMLLQHIILSHHRSAEMGAVVSPAILEAKIVNSADMFSCDMYKQDTLTHGLSGGGIKTVWESNRLVSYYRIGSGD